MKIIKLRDGTYDINMTEEETSRFIVSHITHDYSLVTDFDSVLCSMLEEKFGESQDKVAGVGR